MEIHVICMNDSVQYAVVESKERAEEVRVKLKEEYFELNKWNFADYHSYEIQCYWRIRTVDGESPQPFDLRALHV